jgi:hypothetical protein
MDASALTGCVTSTREKTETETHRHHLSGMRHRSGSEPNVFGLLPGDMPKFLFGEWSIPLKWKVTKWLNAQSGTLAMTALIVAVFLNVWPGQGADCSGQSTVELLTAK